MISFKNTDSIKDFGKQFRYHNKIDGYWASLDMLKDIVHPFDLNSVKNKIICEIGVGSGRILKNLAKFSPIKIYAIEPSDAIEVAKENNIKSDVEIIFKKISGQTINFKNEVDYIFSLGVIHHIPDADLVCKKIYESLKPKGKFVIWLYGKEGNKLYLLIFNNLRKITRFMPDMLLNIFSIFLNLLLSVYIFLCKYFNLPLKNYMLNVLKKCTFEKRKYIIFDQLNPSYSKYYTKKEVESLLTKSGFKKFEIFHRHKYSWTAIAEK
jgi:SAM-dependent methyltransferase